MSRYESKGNALLSVIERTTFSDHQCHLCLPSVALMPIISGTFAIPFFGKGLVNVSQSVPLVEKKPAPIRCIHFLL